MSAPVPASLWRHRSFLAFFTSRTLSVTAFQIFSVAVGWQVYALTRSAWDLGLVGLMQSLSTEFAPHGIRVNTVHPTLVDTEMIINEPTFRAFRPDLANPTRADFDVAAHTLVKLPMEPPALSPDDVSSTVLYLASEDSRYVTGSKHLVDAGGRF